MSFIDLTQPQAILEQLMLDEVIITRDEHHTRDDTLDANTGLMSTPAPPTVLYTGIAKCRPIFRTPPMMEGGQLTVVREYLVSIPISVTAELHAGDKIKFTSSQYDAGLVDKELRIVEVQYKTYAVQRTMRAELRDDISDR